MTQRSLGWFATLGCLLLGGLACGDDEPTADGGTDASHHQAGRGGKGGAGGGGRSGAGGRGGAGGGGGSSAAAGQAVTIRFKAKLGSEDLVCGKSYANLGATKLSATPQDFRFFIEELHLLTGGGEKARVQLDDRTPFQTKDVALLDFTDMRGSCSAGGATVNTSITGTVAAGEYSGVELVIGVPESLNHQNIALAKPPLQDVSTYWGWASGYRFIMAGLLVLPGGGSDPADADGGAKPGANVVHIGSVGCSGGNATGFSCSRPNRNRVKLDGFDADEDSIVADLAKVFEKIDLGAAVDCHGPDPECAPAYAAFGIDLESGAALDAQTVFRVE